MTEKEIQKYLEDFPQIRYGQDTRVIAAVMMLNDEDLEKPDKVVFFNSIREVIDLDYIPALEMLNSWSLKQMEDRILPSIRHSRAYKDVDEHPVKHLYKLDKTYTQKDGTVVHLEPVNLLSKLYPEYVYKYEVLDKAPKDIKNLYVLFMSFSKLEVEEHESKYNCFMPEILMRSVINRCIKSDTSS